MSRRAASARRATKNHELPGKTPRGRRNNVAGKTVPQHVGARSTTTRPKITHPTVKKKRRFKPGTVALREIRRYQNSTNTLITKTGISQAVRGTAADLATATFSMSVKKVLEEFRIQRTGLDCIHEAVEALTVGIMEDSNMCAIHAGRVGIQKKDMQLAARIRGSN